MTLALLVKCLPLDVFLGSLEPTSSHFTKSHVALLTSHLIHYFFALTMRLNCWTSGTDVFFADRLSGTIEMFAIFKLAAATLVTVEKIKHKNRTFSCVTRATWIFYKHFHCGI